VRGGKRKEREKRREGRKREIREHENGSREIVVRTKRTSPLR
jgi:hypothetical protein